MSKPENPHRASRDLPGRYAETAWDTGFRAGIKWAKEAARPRLVLEKSWDTYHDVPVIDWTEVDE